MNIEEIRDSAGDVLAVLVRAELMPDSTSFITPNSYSLQMGMIVYGKDKTITPHMHLPVVRQVEGTNEVVQVRRGSCQIDIFDTKAALVCQRELKQGDLILLRAGGHGFRMLEDTVLFEVKQGPYFDGKDKERF